MHLVKIAFFTSSVFVTHSAMIVFIFDYHVKGFYFLNLDYVSVH